jgi:hypothetical protein
LQSGLDGSPQLQASRAVDNDFMSVAHSNAPRSE